MTSASRADVVIIGGGIAGLWIRAILSREGFGVVLIEKSCLGDGQTLASQGILHRGVKYSFSESAREASEQLASAAAVWEKSLRGEGFPDLRSARVLSECTHLWTIGGVLANLTAWSASKAMRSGVRELGRAEFPAGFVGSPATVRVWRVEEPVLDSKSLLAAVRDAGRGPIIMGEVSFLGETRSRGGVQVEAATYNGETLTIDAECAVCAAGEGNEDLLYLASLSSHRVSQRRPLHMAMIDEAPFELFGHVPQAGTDKPRITITTVRRGTGLVWYVGGNIAERGVDKEDDGFRAAALAEVAACVPWAGLSGSRFSSLRINRAEGRTESGSRPDGPVVRRFERVLAVWPTKLALAPRAAEMTLREVREIVGTPAREAIEGPTLAAEICDFPWDNPGRTWTPIEGGRAGGC